jgi:hypothetical protein
MNVIKTIGRRGVAVGLSLALCAAMVAPAFAKPVALDKEQHIDSASGALKDHENDDGTRSYDYYLDQDIELNKTLVVGQDEDGNAITASIDLNGFELALNKDLDLTQPMEVNVPPKAEKQGAVIVVKKGANLTVTDSSAILKDENGNVVLDEKGQAQYLAGQGTGKITGGTGSCAWDDSDKADNGIHWSKQLFGGGVCVKNNSSFTMTGGKITGNLASGHGGGVANWDGTVTLNGVEISNNRSAAHGGGLYSYAGENTLNGCTVEENRAGGFGGCATMSDDSSVLRVTESVIRNNMQGGNEGVTGVITKDAGVSVTVDNKTSICGNKYLNGKYETSDRRHVWETVVDTPSTCKTHGTGHKVCKSGCAWNGAEADGVVELPLDPDNHTGETEIRGAKASTATEDGYTGDTYCTGCGELLEKGKTIPAIGTSGGSGGAAFPVIDTPATVEIEDEAVPLAGLFTRADAIGYLWEQAGRPEAELSTFEDVPADHVWAEAIGWAQDVGIAVADQEGNFRPDDLVLRWVEDHEAEPEGELEEFLNRCAEFAGIELDAGELFVELGGEPTDIVMGEDAQVIFDSFFAKLEEALEELAA